MSLTKDLADKKTRQYTELYNQYYSLIFSSIYSRVNNFHEAEDICQEVFYLFYQKYDEVQNPRQWLFGVLRNTVLDYYKKRQRKDIDTDELFEDVGLSFVNGFKDTRLIIEEALNELCSGIDDQERIVFDLIAMYNFSYGRVSKDLGLSYKQVRNIYRKMVHKLTLYLNSKGIKKLEDLL